MSCLLVSLFIHLISKPVSISHPFRYKDGVPIERNSTCYKLSNHNLIISDLQLKHAGVFTVSVGNQARGWHRNLSYTLFVNGESQTAPLISQWNGSAVDWAAGTSSRMSGILGAG